MNASTLYPKIQIFAVCRSFISAKRAATQVAGELRLEIYTPAAIPLILKSAKTLDQAWTLTQLSPDRYEAKRSLRPGESDKGKIPLELETGHDGFLQWHVDCY